MNKLKLPVGNAAAKRAGSKLDRSILIGEKEGPPLMRATLLFGSAIVLAFVLWSALTMLEEMEQGTGEIVPAEEPVRIQHPTGGLVIQVLVKEGSRVEEGDALLRMDSTDSVIQRTQLATQLYALQAQRERLMAVAVGGRPDFSNLPAQAAQFVEDQRSLFEASQAQASIALSIAKGQIEQTQLEIERIGIKRASLTRQAALAEEDATITRGLAEKNLAPRAELLAKLRIVESIRNEAETLAAEENQAFERKTEAESRVEEYRASQIRLAKTELATVNERIAQAESSLRRLDGSTGKLEAIAPVGGLVHALAYRTAGTVVGAGAMIAEIIPIGKKPKAQIRIDPKSIGSISPGQIARIKVSAYPSDRYGAFKGRLSEISPTTFIGNDGRPYYRGIIDIEGRELEGAQALDLVPGMTLTVEMKTGQKTLLQYLLKPIFASARESFREK